MAYSRYRISHKKELYYISCIVAVVAILSLSFLGPGGYPDLEKARKELKALQDQVDDLKRSNSERIKTIESLRSDPGAQEKYIREKGYGKAGDIVQEIPPAPENKAK